MDNLKYYLLVAIIFLFVPLHAKYFRLLDISNGLPNNSVRCFAQDKLGFMWIGTFDGLCRYDGANFTIFRKEEGKTSIINNHIQSILPLENGLLVGTLGGLDFYSYQNSSFSNCYRYGNKRVKQGFNIPVNSILRIKNKVFVLGSNYELLEKIGNTLDFKPLSVTNKKECLSIAAYEDMYLIAYCTDGIYLVDTDNGKILSRTNIAKCDSYDHALYYSKISKVIYVCNGIGYNSYTFRVTKDLRIEEANIKSPSNLKTVIDYNGEVFMGTDGNGLISQYNGYVKQFIPQNSDISSDAIHSLFVDKDKNLWIGTYRGGVNVYSDYYDWFKSMTMVDGKLTHGVVTACYSTDKKIYIGLDGGGLNIYDKISGEIKSCTTSNSDIAGNNVLSIVGDENYIWLGIYGKGLCRLSLSDNKFKLFNHPIKEGKKNFNRLWDIKDDGNGNIWIAGDELYLFNKSSQTFLCINELHGLGTSSIMFDGDVCWLCSTNGGIYKMDKRTGKIIKHYFNGSTNFNVPDNRISCIYVDSKHDLWFAIEYAGLYKLDEKSGMVICYSNNDVFKERNILSIQEDSSGNYWLGTGNGLFRYDPNKPAAIRFGKEDNLPFLQYNYNASFSKDGIFYFGAIGGLTWFNPSKIKYNSTSSLTYFTALELLDYDKNKIPLYGSMPKEVHLPYNHNFFTIYFSSPQFVSSNKNRFLCLMENFGQKWQEVSSDGKLSFTNVPPGKYKFYVKSLNADGSWSNNVSCLSIVIESPWWATNWAILIWCVIAVVLLSFIIWFFWHEAKIKNMVVKNEMEKDTVRKISEAKLSFFTNITHELRTPIFLITAPLEELITSGKGVIQIPKSYLAGMYRNAMRLNKLISRIIDLRKLESGNLKLEYQRQNVVSFCKELTLDYEALCQQKNIIFYFHPSKTVIQLDFDPDKLELMLSNLVSNAFKYTAEGGRIIFSIEDNEDSVFFTVEDNGIGIKEDYHEAIFDSFFQVNPLASSSSGDGIGLSFVKHLVELHSGEIKVYSKMGEGSKFVITMPKQNIAYSNEMSERNEVIVKEGLDCDEKENNIVQKQSPMAIHSILVIDDERETVEILERFLIEDFKVLKAYNGLDGWSIAQEEIPDIIICDIMMPKMNGTEFLSIVKKDKKLCNIPVIMFTAKSSDDDKMAAFDGGADAYLTKPISLGYLRKRIDNLISRKETTLMTNIICKSNKSYTKEEQRFLLKCKEIIDDNITNADFDVALLANVLGMSHSSLYRKVKNVTNMSVIEFINEYRIFKAVQLFNDGETNITNVCVKCGFNDPKNFREVFKKKMNVSPKQYVQQI